MRAPRKFCVLVFGILAALAMSLPASDHRDDPTLANSRRVGALDLNDLYVFRSPSNANNTVFVLTVSPFAGAGGQSAFSPGVKYEIVVDHAGNGVESFAFRATFGGRKADGTQSVKLAQVVPGGFPETLVRGATGQNLPIEGGGQLRAGVFDDPAFFDQTGFDARLAGPAQFPRPVGVAKNLYGPNANTLGIVIEIPSARVRGRFSGLIAVHGRTVKGGKQIDRVGRPFTNKFLIPPVPRGPVTNPEDDLRPEFNRAKPRGDVATFTAPMIGVLQGFFGRSLGDAAAITALFLPDALIFETGNPNGFGTFVSGGSATFLGNGRRLRDDAADIMLNFLSNGAIPTDNIPDDNGTRITDGNMGTVAAFPYIGAANDPAGGPNEG